MKTHMCVVCQATSKRNIELKRHKATFHTRRRLHCEKCEKDFSRKDSLTRHVRVVHGNGHKPSCRFCARGLSRKDAVWRHESMCSKNPANRFNTRISTENLATTPQIEMKSAPKTAKDITVTEGKFVHKCNKAVRRCETRELLYKNLLSLATELDIPVETRLSVENDTQKGNYENVVNKILMAWSMTAEPVPTLADLVLVLRELRLMRLADNLLTEFGVTE